jgi:dihydrofolate synthase / folylpolyglutamate synthase
MSDHFPDIHDYRSALAFLFGRINYERTGHVPYRSRRFKLERMRRLAARLGHPEGAFPAIHVAGTKGKGSTAAMIASVLSTAAYRTGLYTSPHLNRLEERFVVDGRPCTPDELVGLLAHLQPAVRELDELAWQSGEHQGPSYFEITTAAALVHFRNRQVDCAVLEVGLGGRLDSTNICHPVVSVITSISFDHMRQLGRTLAAIAGEKAGIIKRRVPVVTGVVQREPRAVIERTAAEHDAPLLALGSAFDFEYLPNVGASELMSEGAGDWLCGLDYRDRLEGGEYRLPRVVLGMLGRHQASNAAVALATLRRLRQAGWRVEESVMRQGLAQTRCPSRIEILSRAPTIILDAAHNPASITALLELLDERFPREPRVLVFATSTDKEARTMLDLLLPHFDRVVLTRYSDNPRSADPVELARLSRAIQRARGLESLSVHVGSDPRAAWELVQTFLTADQLVCITGSFFLAGEMRPLLQSAGHLALECG